MMKELLKEKKILYRLMLLVLITTPLFAFLGGTPFLTFNFNELSNILPGIYFVALITLLFWVINISLLGLAEKYYFFKKIILRAAISIVVGLSLSTAVFYFFRLSNPPPPMHTDIATAQISKRPVLVFDADKNEFKFSAADSNFRHPSPKDFKMPASGFFFFPQIVRSLAINLIILTLCELVFLYFRKQKVENENARLRQSNLEAKNNQLKMQLHPHFLFNSLNTLRVLLKKDADKAEDYLLKLSDILRFSTTSALQDMVDIKDELKLCLSYLQMQKVRFGDMLHFVISNSQLHSAKGKLPVYSLQLLAENAIKHNSFTNEDPLTIFIDYDEAANTITIKNKIQRRRMMEVTTKIGLKNLEERYQLLSNESIIVLNTGNQFAVKIKILPPNQNA